MKFDTNQTDATLLWVVNSRCNLSCPFCSNLEIHSKKEHSKQFSSIKNKLLLNYKRILKLPDLGLGGLKIVIEERIRNKFFPQLPERIRIPDLIRTLDNSGKKFLINFTGGEPLLVSNIIEACQELTLHGHRIILNTNLTTGDIEGFCKKVPIESVVCIYASGHLRDIRNKKLMSLYLDNLQLCQKKGFNIIINEVAYPAYKRDVAIYKDFFAIEKTTFKFIPFKGTLWGKHYPESYTDEEIAIFGLSKADLDGYFRKGTLCSAGHNAMVVNVDGVVKHCFEVDRIHGNIYSKIKFNDKLCLCPSDICPFFGKIDSGFFNLKDSINK